MVNVYTSAHNHKLKYRVTNTAKACILMPFALSPILPWKPGRIKQCHPASQQWQSPICPLDDSPCPKAPAGTQTHFTFPSEVSLLFSVHTPRSEGEGGGSDSEESGAGAERGGGGLTGKH